MIPTRIGRLRAAAAASAALALAVTSVGAPPAQAAQAAASQVVGFTVGQDGRFYLASSGGLSPFGSTVVAPPGADVSAVRQADGNAAVFTVGTQGGLVSAVTSSATSNITVYRDGASNLATPGTQLNALAAPDGYVYVFFVGNDGAVYSASYNRVVRPGVGPQRVSPPGVAPSGAVIAGVWQSSGPGAFFVGDDGGLRYLSRTGTGTWQTSSVGPPGVAAAGSGVAALTSGGVQAYYAGLDGRLWQISPAGGGLPDPWNRLAVSAAGVVPVGARLAATRASGGPTGVFFAGADGAVRVVTNLTSGWQESVTTGPGVAKPGGPVSALAYGDYLITGWCGNDLWWWLHWWWRRPPSPPPPWWGETTSFPLGYPIEYGANISLTLYR
ncbi:hypothetical protein [Micromonospora sp. NPDC092111]|uniref:hypothetical protein n=1 Tax=Micromonospora sp. NPDC092111 TaxID=3364289 RepID=UPI0037FFEBBB